MDRYFIGDYYVSDSVKPIQIKVRMPIEWMALDKTDDGKTLLYSKNCLDWEMYHHSDDKPVSWTDSYMNKYLKGCYDRYFTEEEKNVIIESSYGKLFLLSEEEIEKYLPRCEQRRTIGYFVEEDDGIRFDFEHYSYWLRGEDCPGDEVPYIDSLGDVEHGYASRDEVGIRIAMWVDTKKARLITAGKGYNKWHHLWEAEDF